MKLKRQIITAFLCFIISISLIGCSNSMAGIYALEGSSEKSFIELKEDGTFTQQKEGANSTSGKFEINEDTITLRITRGAANVLQIENKTLIDYKGDRWTKK